MNLPLAPDQMASRGSKELGYTEMKGSWFIFDSYRAHEDWVLARAVLARQPGDGPKSHENYHLGFRCCKPGRRQLTRLSGSQRTARRRHSLGCRATRKLSTRP